MKSNRQINPFFRSPFYNWKSSTTFKIWVFLLVTSSSAHLIPNLRNWLVGDLEQVWSGQFWIPFVNGVVLDNPLVFFLSLTGFFFLGIPAERRLGPRVYPLFLLSTQLLSSVIALFMLESAGGGLSGVLAALLILFAIPPRYYLRQGFFFRTMVVLFSFQFFGFALASLDFKLQMAYYVQMTIGMCMGMLFLLVGRLHTHFTRKYILVLGILASVILVFYNPWHSKWSIVRVNKAYAESAQKGEALLRYELNHSPYPKSRIELARSILEGKLEQGDKKQALLVLDSLKDYLYAREILSYHYLGKFDLKALDHKKALENLEDLPLQYPPVLIGLATVYCGSLDSTLHQGEKGMRVARSLNEYTAWSDPNSLDVFASCAARLGQFSQAQSYLERALHLSKEIPVDSLVLLRIEKNLERVHNHRPIVYPLLASMDRVNPIDSMPVVTDSLQTPVLDALPDTINEFEDAMRPVLGAMEL